MYFLITSIKTQSQILDCSYEDACSFARVLNDSLQPAYGVQVQAQDGATVFDTEDEDESLAAVADAQRELDFHHPSSTYWDTRSGQDHLCLIRALGLTRSSEK